MALGPGDRRVRAVDAGQGHGNHAAGGVAGLRLVAARPHWMAGPAGRAPLPFDRGGHGGSRGLDPTPGGRRCRRRAHRRFLEPGGCCGLRRVVLPLEADLAARPVFCLSPLADRRLGRTILFARRALGDRAGAGLAAAACLGPTAGDADRVLRGTAAAGAGLREHLVHAILVGRGSLAVRGHDRTLRHVRRGRCDLRRPRKNKLHSFRAGVCNSSYFSADPLRALPRAAGNLGRPDLAAEPDVWRYRNLLPHDARHESRLLDVPQQPRFQAGRPGTGQRGHRPLPDGPETQSRLRGGPQQPGLRPGQPRAGQRGAASTVRP